MRPQTWKSLFVLERTSFGSGMSTRSNRRRHAGRQIAVTAAEVCESRSLPAASITATLTTESISHIADADEEDQLSIDAESGVTESCEDEETEMSAEEGSNDVEADYVEDNDDWSDEELGEDVESDPGDEPNLHCTFEFVDEAIGDQPSEDAISGETESFEDEGTEMSVTKGPNDADAEHIEENDDWSGEDIGEEDEGKPEDESNLLLDSEFVVETIGDQSSDGYLGWWSDDAGGELVSDNTPVELIEDYSNLAITLENKLIREIRGDGTIHYGAIPGVDAVHLAMHRLPRWMFIDLYHARPISVTPASQSWELRDEATTEATESELVSVTATAMTSEFFAGNVNQVCQDGSQLGGPSSPELLDAKSDDGSQTQEVADSFADEEFQAIPAKVSESDEFFSSFKLESLLSESE